MRNALGLGRTAASVAATVAILGIVAGAAPEPPVLVTTDPAGLPGNNHSYEGGMTPSARYVTFDSKASNLLPAATGGFFQIFVLDRKTGVLELVSADANGVQGNGNSGNPAISSNGRYVLFQSSASNLVPGDENGAYDVFLYDRRLGVLSAVSADADGNTGNGTSFSYGATLSPNGRFAVFSSSASNIAAGADNGIRQVILADLRRGTKRLISADALGEPADATCGSPSISPNGRWVSYHTAATNLVPGDGNGFADAFVTDAKKGTTVRVSLSTTGGDPNGSSYDPVVSNNGRFATFYSTATNLVAGDGNNKSDVFLHNARLGTTTRLSVGPGGVEGNGHSGSPSISSNGKSVLFYSDATNLTAGGESEWGAVFLWDAKSGAAAPINLGPAGEFPDDSSYTTPNSLVPSGRWAIYSSASTQWAGADPAGKYQIYVKRLR